MIERSPPKLTSQPASNLPMDQDILRRGLYPNPNRTHGPAEPRPRSPSFDTDFSAASPEQFFQHLLSGAKEDPFCYLLDQL